jgi:hypothetical protein
MHLKPTAECQISILIFEPRHLSQLNTRAIPLTWPKVGKNFAVLDIFFYGIFIETPLHNFFSNIRINCGGGVSINIP